MEVCESKFCVLERESLLLRQQMADIVIAVGGVGCGGWCCGCDIQISPVSSPAGPCSCAVWAVISSLQRATVTSSQRLAAAAASHRSVVSRPSSSEHLAWPGRVTSQSPSTPFSFQYFPLYMSPKNYLKSYQSKVKCMSFKIWETQYIISVFSLYQTLNCCLDPCSLTLLHIYFLTVMIIQGKLSKRSPLLNIL